MRFIALMTCALVTGCLGRSLVGEQPVGHRVIRNQVAVPMEKADDLVSFFKEGHRSSRDNGVGGGCRATREYDSDSAHVGLRKRARGSDFWRARRGCARVNGADRGVGFAGCARFLPVSRPSKFDVRTMYGVRL